MNAAPLSRLARFWQALPRLSTTWMLVLSFTTSQTLTWIQPEEAEATSVDEAKAMCDQFMKEVAPGQGLGSLGTGGGFLASPTGTSAPELSARAVFSRCQAPADVQAAVTSPNATASSIPTSNPLDDKFEECKSRLMSSWRTLGPHCVVILKGDVGITAQYISMYAYLAAAITCFVSWILVLANEWQGAGMTWGKGLFVACLLLGAVGFAADVTAMIQLGATQGASGPNWDQGVSSLISALAVVVPALKADLSIATGINTTQSAVALGILTSVFLGLFFLKMASLTSIESSRNTSAHEVGTLASEISPVGGGPFSVPSAAPAPVRLGGGGGGGLGGGGASAGGAGSGGAGGGGALDSVNQEMATQSGLERSFNASSAFSKGDPLAGKLTKDNRLADTMKSLNALGGDLPKAMGAALGGKGLGGALAGMGGPFAQLGSRVSGEQIAQFEKLAKEEIPNSKLAAEALGGGAIVSGSGSAGSKTAAAGAGANPFGSMFGAKTPASDAAAVAKFGDKETKKNPLDDLPESTDIWHGGDARSIFQIISRRIDKTRDRTHTLDWESKLNRAIHGSLLSKPAPGTPSKSNSGTTPATPGTPKH